MSNNKPFVEVVATLIWNGDKFLICQRPANKAKGLLMIKVEKGLGFFNSFIFC